MGALYTFIILSQGFLGYYNETHVWLRKSDNLTGIGYKYAKDS